MAQAGLSIVAMRISFIESLCLDHLLLLLSFLWSEEEDLESEDELELLEDEEEEEELEDGLYMLREYLLLR